MGCRIICGQFRLCWNHGFQCGYNQMHFWYDAFKQPPVVESDSQIDRICSYDSLDPTAAPSSIREQVFTRISERLVSSNSIITGLRIGVPREYFPAELSSEIIEPIRNVMTRLKFHGATILPSTPFALSSYSVLASAEASSNLARSDGIQYGAFLFLLQVFG